HRAGAAGRAGDVATPDQCADRPGADAVYIRRLAVTAAVWLAGRSVSGPAKPAGWWRCDLDGAVGSRRYGSAVVVATAGLPADSRAWLGPVSPDRRLVGRRGASCACRQRDRAVLLLRAGRPGARAIDRRAAVP